MTSPTLAASLPPVKPIGFGTLLRVETRKMTDTRGGRGVLAAIVALALVVAVWQIFTVGDGSFTASNFMMGPVQIAAMLAPVIGLMAMTSEFTQRTALTTFTLAPRRLSVLLAKPLSAIALTIATIAAAILISLAGAALAGAFSGEAVSYAGVGDTIRGFVLTAAMMSVLAAAIGTLIPQTAIAIAVYFIAPTAFSLLGMAVLKSADPWFNVFSAVERLSGGDPTAHLDQTLTAVLVWVVIPAVIGTVRALRREVK
ncbi:hypothetical protein CLV47_107143 [Antricoccus suffuscus]|uniref:ABC-2 type transport system permease protein n=1 Tax=Antricoccus suffuscus TaxID=1629062 RepID=A0A2T1A083_9ACTN|nr:ABC transporter permease [Antricoccus suffuscus]PRZ42015.1 hypothetical protein CLV47_107143 [Antricoccus suffuscus]